MVERPKIGLENPTRRARLRGVYRGVNLLDRISNTSERPRDAHGHRKVRPNGLSVAREQPIQIKDITPHLPKQAKSRVLKRHIPKPDYKTYPKHKRPMMRMLAGLTAIMVVSVGLIGTALIVGGKRPLNAKDGSSHSVLGSIVTGSNASETEPSQNLNDYQVAADSPRFLVIEKIGVKARVGTVQQESTNTLSAPANIFDVGWYASSSKPGEPGAIVINGHVSGSTKRGVFYSIGTLKAGDQLEIERGDGKKFTYTVKETEAYDNDKVDMNKILASIEPGKPALNLISSTGRFNVRTNQFEQRLAVYAVQD